MEQSSHNRLMAAVGSMLTLYSLYRIDLKIRTSFIYLINLSLFNFLLLVAVVGLIALVLHKERVLRFIKNINFSQIKSFLIEHGLLISIFLLIIFGFFYSKKESITNEDIRNNLSIFQVDELFQNDNKIYLDDNFTQLTNEFNENLQTIIKMVHKKLSNRLKQTKILLKNNSTVYNETNNETASNLNLNYIDSDYIYLFNYLNKTLPLFLNNQTIVESTSNESLIEEIGNYVIKFVSLMIFVSLSSYTALKLLSQREELEFKSTLKPKRIINSIILKDNECQTSTTYLNSIENNAIKEPNIIMSQSLIEISKPVDTKFLHPFDFYGSKNLLPKTTSVLTLTNEEQEEELLKLNILKELSDDAASNVINWLLFLGLDNLLNDSKTNASNSLRLNQTKLVNKIIQNLKVN